MENQVEIIKQVNVQMFKYGDVELPVKTYADGSIEFNAEQAAIGFGLTKISKGKDYVRWERVNEYLGLSRSGQQIKRGDFITEPQFYKLAIKANNQVAEKFQNWVTSEVLPSIRKHGAYMTNEKIEEALLNPDTLIKLATELKKEREGRLLAEHRNIMNRPKVLFADAVSVSDTPILIGELAKILKQNGVETLEVDGKTLAMGPNNLFKWMRANGYLINRKGTDYNTPTQKAMKLKLFRIKESTHVSGDGVVKITKTSKVTGKGQQYFVNKFLGTVTKGLEVSGNESE